MPPEKTETHVCGRCQRSFDTALALKMHQTRLHNKKAMANWKASRWTSDRLRNGNGKPSALAGRRTKLADSAPIVGATLDEAIIALKVKRDALNEVIHDLERMKG